MSLKRTVRPWPLPLPSAVIHQVRTFTYPHTLFGTSTQKKPPVFLSRLPGICGSDGNLTSTVSFSLFCCCSQALEMWLHSYSSCLKKCCDRNALFLILEESFCHFVLLFFHIPAFSFSICFFPFFYVSHLQLWEQEMNLYIFPLF